MIGNHVIIYTRRINMETKDEKQARLIIINNLCASFSVAVEKHYNKPEADALLELIKKLAEECGDYLKTSVP
jgi:hypothetical protein